MGKFKMTVGGQGKNLMFKFESQKTQIEFKV